MLQTKHKTINKMAIIWKIICQKLDNIEEMDKPYNNTILNKKAIFMWENTYIMILFL